MVNILLINLAIIIICVFIQWQIIIKLINMNRHKHKINLFIGITSGIAGTVLMLYSINIDEYILMDLKHIIIALSAVYGSPISALVCSAIIATMRIVLYGVSTPSFVAFTGILFIGFIFAYIGRSKKTTAFRFIAMNLISATYMFGSLYYILGFGKPFLHHYVFFITISFIGGCLCYFVCEYARISYENFKQLSYYGLIVNNSSDLICIHDLNSKLKYVSPSITKLLGYKAKEFLGKFTYDFIHPQDLDYIHSQHELLLKQLDVVTSAYKFRKKDGSYIWLESKAHLVKDPSGSDKEVISISRDVTSRKLVEDKLKSANDRLVTIFNNGGTAITVRDINQKPIDVSQSYLNMLGYKDVKEVEYFSNIVPLEDRQRESVFFKDLLDGKINSYRIEKRYIKKDGSILWGDVIVTLLPNENGNPLVIGMMNDITDRKQYEKMLLDMELKLKRANEELKEKNKILTELSFSDGLTGIPNRRYFQISLEKEWKRAQRIFKPITLLMIDVDYFKIFNDTYGHVQGDECLKIIAKTLKSTVNRSTDLTARLGGEEFSVLLPDTDEDGGKSIATKILEAISALKIPNENSKAMPYVTVSIGICSLVPTVNCEAEDFIHAADMALYSAKESGRNRFQVFNNVIGSKNSINEDLELWKKIEGMAIDK